MCKLGATSIPYGISDFKRIRNEGYYYIDKTAYINRLEAAGSFIFFVRPRRFGKSLLVDMLRSYYDIKHSYIIELKHSKEDASDAELAAKREEGLAQLRRYASDPLVPKLAEGTQLHVILYQFRGKEIVRLEEV